MLRDREGSFEPKLLGKRQTTLGEGLDNRILSLYSKGMSYQDIQEHLEDLYGLEISSGQLSAITDKILPLVEQWRSRPLEPVYAFLWRAAGAAGCGAFQSKARWQSYQQSRLQHLSD